jgi:hypothetical protein
MMLLGLAVAHRVVSAGTLGTASAIRHLVGGGFLGVIAMIAIYLATLAADVVNDYTGSLSIQAAGLRVRRPVVAALNGGAAFALSAWFLYGSGALYNKVENLLLFFTYWISAWLGVVIVDWVRRKGRVNTAELQDFAGLRWSAPALIASWPASPARSRSPTRQPALTSSLPTPVSRTSSATSGWPAARGRPRVHRRVRRRRDPVRRAPAHPGHLGPSRAGGRAR